MFAKILKWLLTAVDISVVLSGDDLTIVLKFSGMTVANWTIDLLKDGIGPDPEGLSENPYARLAIARVKSGKAAATAKKAAAKAKEANGTVSYGKVGL